MANTTWSTTDKSASPTLSGGNLVVSFTINSMAGIRSADRVYSGQYYWENTFTSNNGTAIGICAGTANLAALDTTVPGSLVVEVIGPGGIWNNGSSTGLSVGGTITSGWVACVALDATNGRVWFRNGAAGNWNGSASANPATGVGGVNISGWASAGLTGLYSCASGSLGSTSITANFGASAFTGAVPAGFNSGFPDSTTLLNVAANTQMLVEEWGAPNPAAQVTQLLLEEWTLVPPYGDMRATQIAAEQWANMIPPQMQATQTAIEQWTSTNNLTTRMLATQAAIEQWSPVTSAVVAATRQAAVTVVT